MVIQDINQTKDICLVIIKERSKIIEINGIRNNIQEVGIAHLVKFKRELVNPQEIIYNSNSFLENSIFIFEEYFLFQ